MNTLPGNIIVDSCQYTPVYLVQETGAIQGKSYILSQGNSQEVKPVTDNLKRFYENSGIFENNLVNNVPNITKPRILKKQGTKQIKTGNNLKLASFLLPKNNQDHNFNINKQCLPVNSVILKPTVVTPNVVTPVSRDQLVTREYAVKLEHPLPREYAVKLEHPLPREHAVKLEHPLPREHNKLSRDVIKRENPVPKDLLTPREDVDRKIVKIKNFPECLKMVPKEKPLPKIKPKEEPPATPPIKHTSVQLLKLGDTYHSINQLSDEQMKMVNKALKIFSDPEKTMEPLYDPVTNTRYVYKVVSPRDLTVVGNNKLIMNEKPNETEETKKEKERKKVKPLRVTERDMFLKKIKPIKELVQEKEKSHETHNPEVFVEPEQPEEIKVTRSGRKVKLPKQIVPEIPHKPKKKTQGSGVLSCFQCSTDFCSFYRLQKHYETYPGHIPADIHTNLFHCLLAIIKSGSEEDSANVFIQQLEHLVEKLKSILPCLLQMDGNEGKSCTINDDIGRLFGLNPGSYNFNMDGLSCVKNKDGKCRHSPPLPTRVNLDTNIQWLPAQTEEHKNGDGETEDCARINSVDKWPTAKKRIWKPKTQTPEDPNAKKMKLTTENAPENTTGNCDPLIELELENLVNFSTIEPSAIDVQPKVISLLDELDLDVGSEILDLPILTPQPESCSTNPTPADEEPKKTSGPHTQFHSTHFDIRSSPMKPSAAIFRKIQINPEKLPKYEVQIIRPIELETEQEKCPDVQESSTIPPIPEEPPDLHSLFKDDMIQLSPCKQPSLNLHELNFDTAKDWILDNVNDKSNESFLRTTGAIEPSLLHNNMQGDKLQLDNLVGANEQLGDSDNRLLSSQNSSVLNFLESLGNECLLYPETDIRINNHVESVDFQLDLFSFSNP